MPCKLTYFDGRGRAESIRFILALAGQEYEDIRIGFEEWGNLKPKTPLSTLPLLEIDGETLNDTVTQGSFLASKFSLQSKEQSQAARQHMLANYVEFAIIDKIVLWKFPVGEAFKVTIEKNLKEARIPAALTVVDRNLKKSSDGNKFIVGDTVSWADCFVVNALMWVNNFDPSQLDSFPALVAYRKRFEEIPAIAEWIKKRPDSFF